MPPNPEVLKWQRFFVAAGIPGAIASKYSKSFADQRVQFSMLDDLDKATLIELGVVTVGDQIAILRYIRQMKASQQVEPMDCNTSVTVSKSTVKEKKATSSAPDRDDIYHIRLPAGTTPKTRAILQKHSILKSAGLLKRGSSGIRQSGKDLVVSSKQNIISRQNRLNEATSNISASEEVSSTTDDLYDRLGVKGLVSDQLSSPKRTIRVGTSSSSSASLFERAISDSTSGRAVEPIFRVRIDEMQDRAWESHGRANIPMRSTFTGAITKQTIRNVRPLRNGLRLGGIKKVQTVSKIRPSVFDRLG